MMKMNREEIKRLEEINKLEKKINMSLFDFMKCIEHTDDDLYMIKDGEIVKVIKDTDTNHEMSLVLRDGKVEGCYFYFSVKDRFDNEYELKFDEYGKTFFFELKDAMKEVKI